jgi:anhydro-N-acetylmuramic acid kinase
MSIYIGLMSGTSMDGIDAAIVDVDSHSLLAGITVPYSKKTQIAIENLANEPIASLERICGLNRAIGEEFSQATLQLINQAKIDRCVIRGVGNHGQTIVHNTAVNPSYTLQLGCSHTIAEKTGLTVVGDFRTRDLIVGGQGAPFAPLYHQEIFKGAAKAKAVVNIGGISNVTFFEANQARGFDIGPGNCLMDTWIKLWHGMPFDRDGEWAASGKVSQPLLASLLNDSFFKIKPPKSIGKEYFDLPWLENYLSNHPHPPQDIQSTLLELTSHTIVDVIKDHKYTLEYLILCGGGARNQTLRKSLQAHLPQLNVVDTHHFGINSDYLEAMLFAWLASKTLAHEAVNLMRITGASKPSILGCIYPQPC